MYKLMITDDEPDILNGLFNLLNWADFNIDKPIMAGSCDEAIALAVEEQPDIILADIKFDDGWGYEIIDNLSNRGLHPLFVMISGYDDFNYVRRSFLSGAKEYIVKPVNKKNLEEILLKLINENLGGSIVVNSENETDPVTGKLFSEYTGITKKLINIIKSNYKKAISLLDIADNFKMNNKYIGRIFIKDTGLKFSEYLYSYRMILAKSLIQNTDEKVAVIAHQVGYPQLNYFYTHFRKFFNMSPNDLRGNSEDDQDEVEN